jgi:hypothetical protein
MNKEQQAQQARIFEFIMRNYRRDDGRKYVPKPRKPPKDYWTKLNSAQYKIAFHRNGTVDVRVIEEDHCVIRMDDRVIKLHECVTRIEPNGLVRYDSTRLTPPQLSGKWVADLVDEVTAAVRAWVDGAEGRQMPSGLVRVQERLRKARELTAPMTIQEERDLRAALLYERLEWCMIRLSGLELPTASPAQCEKTLPAAGAAVSTATELVS